ncbi:hypothetical protein Tco_0314623, partial [Tanacetum coccineum]
PYPNSDNSPTVSSVTFTKRRIKSCYLTPLRMDHSYLRKFKFMHAIVSPSVAAYTKDQEKEDLNEAELEQFNADLPGQRIYKLYNNNNNTQSRHARVWGM